MLRNHNTRFRRLKTYVPLAIAPALLLSATVQADRLMAQSAATEFTMPDSVPDGTAIKIDGDNSMAAINAALTEQFAQTFNGTEVTAETSGTGPALQAVLDGGIDLAAIGRPLTDEEKAQGLVEIAIARHKIAIFVDPENPYADDLKIAQFGQIFRGEVTDWSELGGTAGPIRFVDRPDTSDTRSAFRNYPVFKSAPFETGATADPVAEDTTDAVVEALGTEGVGYAIADQVTERSDVRILSMHSVMPTDQRYPFSQPLAYVYKGPEPNPAVQAFLGYATAPENEGIVEEARKLAATGAPVVAAQSTTTPTTEADPAQADPAQADPDVVLAPADGAPAEPAEVPVEEAPADGGATDGRGAAGWWPWLLIPVAGGLLWWLLGRGGGGAAGGAAAGSAAAGAISPVVGEDASRLIMTPRNSRDGYAYWELNDRDRNRLRQADSPQLRLYEVNPGSTPKRPSLKMVQQVSCDVDAQDQHISISTDNKAYLTELGYEADGRWHMVARSKPVHVPSAGAVNGERVGLGQAAPATGGRGLGLAAGAAGLGGLAAGAAAAASSATAKTTQSATNLAGDVTNRVSTTTADITNRVGSTKADATKQMGTTAKQMGSTAKQMGSTAKQMGTATGDTTQRFGANLAGKAAAVGGAAAGAATAGGAWLRRDRSKLAGVRPDLAEDDRIILVPRNSQDAYAYWEVSEAHKKALRDAGGKVLKLRIQDVTGIDIDHQPPFSTQEYICEETAQDRHVPILVRDRDYIADLGYETEDGRWLRLIRSFHIRVG
ncbi:MAG: DUF4912 domain-containing protein [Cyanobacteria bacterium J06635_1]